MKAERSVMRENRGEQIKEDREDRQRQTDKVRQIKWTESVGDRNINRES